MQIISLNRCVSLLLVLYYWFLLLPSTTVLSEYTLQMHSKKHIKKSLSKLRGANERSLKKVIIKYTDLARGCSTNIIVNCQLSWDDKGCHTALTIRASTKWHKIDRNKNNTMKYIMLLYVMHWHFFLIWNYI